MDSSDDFESDPFNARPLKRIKTKGAQSPSQKLKSGTSRNKENNSRNPKKVVKSRPRGPVTNVTTKYSQKVQTSSQCRPTQTQNLGETSNKGKILILETIFEI